MRERAKRGGKSQVGGGPEDAPLPYEFYLLLQVRLEPNDQKSFSSHTKFGSKKQAIHILICTFPKIPKSSHWN